MRKELLDDIYNLLKNSGIFKEGYKGVIPAVTVPKLFPSFAVAIDNEQRKRDRLTECKFEHELTVIVMLYQQGRSNIYEDLLSPIVEQVEDLINNDDTVNNKVIDIWVDKITQDGGILHPKSLAELELKIIYRR